MSKIFKDFYGVINDKQYKDIHQFLNDLQIMQDEKNEYEKTEKSFSEFVDFLREHINDDTKELINDCNEQEECNLRCGECNRTCEECYVACEEDNPTSEEDNVTCKESYAERKTSIYGYTIPYYNFISLFDDKDNDELDNVLQYQYTLKNNFDAMCDNIDNWSLDTLKMFKEDLKKSEKEFAYYQVFIDLAKNYIQHASEIAEDTIVSKSYEKEMIENKTTESNMMDSIKNKCGNFLTQEEMEFLKKNLK